MSFHLLWENFLIIIFLKVWNHKLNLLDYLSLNLYRDVIIKNLKTKNQREETSPMVNFLANLGKYDGVLSMAVKKSINTSAQHFVLYVENSVCFLSFLVS